jgi:hypothetical protein
MRHSGGVALLLAFLASLPLTAQTLVLEAKAGIEDLTYCDYVHVLVTCHERHVSNLLPPIVGGILELDGESHIVEWIGPGYHLESGVIVQPMGDTQRGLKGQLWLEVYPTDQEKIHRSQAWEDVDGNRALSASDFLTFEAGPALEVKDVRLQLRVRPARREQ